MAYAAGMELDVPLTIVVLNAKYRCSDKISTGSNTGRNKIVPMGNAAEIY